MEAERLVIELRNKVLTLEVQDFSDNNIDTEDLFQIHYDAIIGDIITFPVIFNRIANIKAEMDAFLRESQFDMKIYEAQLYEKHRSLILAAGSKVTEGAIDMAIKRDPNYKTKMYQVFKIQKQADMVDAMYWSAKSKGKMLEAVSMKIKPEEFETEIVAETINSVMIRSHKNHFENKRK